MTKLIDVYIPNLGPNDEFAVITHCLKENGEYVKKDEPILNIETTKTSFEILAESEGYIYINFEEGDEVGVGEKVAYILEKPETILSQSNILNEVKNESLKQSYIFTKKAEQLFDKYKIDKSKLPNDKIIRVKDLEKYIKQDNYEIPLNDDPMAVFIYGGGGHGKMCIDILKQMGTYRIVGIIDDVLEVGDHILGIPVIGCKLKLEELRNKGYKLAINGIGAVLNNNIRTETFKLLKENGFIIPNIIHPKASIEPSVKLGEGNQIMSNAVIGSDAELGVNNIINCGAIVSHDCKLSNNIHITPGAILAGSVHVGENSVIGMGATLFMRVNVGKNVVIHNRCNITKDISDNEIIRQSIN